MAVSESWQKAEIPGTQKAFLIQKPQVIASLLKKSKRKLVIIGSEAFEGLIDEVKIIQYIRELSQKSGAHIYVSGKNMKKMMQHDFEPHSYGSILEVANKLKTKKWRGLDGKGNYDMILFLGLAYYLGWLILSGLKNFSENLTTVSLEPYYQPNAKWSLPNKSNEAWGKFIEEIISGL